MKLKLPGLIPVIILLFLAESVVSSPGFPGLVRFKQPDGTRIHVFIKGDEFINWAETEDGYTLLFNNKGGYEYAVRGINNHIEPSGHLAHDIPVRSMHEVLLLSGTSRGLRFSSEQIVLLRSLQEIFIENMQPEAAFPTLGNRKLVCILMGFKDLAFSKTQADFFNLFNQILYRTDGATGSVRDYFREVSYNKLDLDVTVAGPYTAANNMSYYGRQTSTASDANPSALIAEAVNLADPDINYAEFDNDNNGSVDGVYVIFAGYGQESGASTDAVWSHASNISTVYKDGKSISRYACSPELRENSGSGLTRIGVICHEFGHVLGSPDFYDTDYETGGSFEGTKTWDLMASGSWNNSGATPAHPNGFTKVVSFNWATASELISPSTITLNNAAEFSNSFFRINTTTPGEYFFLENREKHLFDAFIPGSGLIIYHVHKDVLSSGNSINTTHPQKMYPVSQNATTEPNSTPSSYGSINSATCAWTGTGKNEFSDTSVPGSKSWSGANTGKPVTNITRNAANKIISFDFIQNPLPPAPVATPASNISRNSFDANWIAASGATGYHLDVAADIGFTDILTAYNNLFAGNVTSYRIDGLVSCSTYYYRVKAVNANGTSPVSNSVETQTTCLPAAALTIGEVTGFTGSSVCIPVSAAGLSDAAGFRFTLSYDPEKLTFQYCTAWGGGCNGTAVQITPLAGGKVTFTYYDTPVNLVNGKFFEICFTVNPGASGSVPLSWSDNPILPVFFNSLSETIPCTYTDGALIVNPGWSLTGQLLYPNYSTHSSTILPGIPVILSGTTLAGNDTSITDASGNFFFQGLETGNYTIRPEVNLPWGGVTAMDVTFYKKHIGGAILLEPIQVASGDVNGSGTLTSLDLTLIKQRIGAMISSFPAGDFVCYPVSVEINHADLVQDIRVLCNGDANGSYAVAGNVKMAEAIFRDLVQMDISFLAPGSYLLLIKHWNGIYQRKISMIR